MFASEDDEDTITISDGCTRGQNRGRVPRQAAEETAPLPLGERVPLSVSLQRVWDLAGLTQWSRT